MRAVCAEGAGGPQVLKIVERPKPQPEAGQLLVEVYAAGINRPDVMQREGNYAPPPGASDIFGLEFSGRVIATGAGVQRYKIGDAVMGLVAGGAYAEYVVVDEVNALPVPDSMRFVDAACVPETYFTVWSNLFLRAGLKKGETVLLHGGGSGIGTTAIKLAKMIGAKVLVTAGSDEKCGICVELGADASINYKTEDFVARTKELTGGNGADVILDMVGGDYIARNLEAVAFDGRISQIAFLQGSKVNIDFMPLLLKRITLTGSTLRARPVAMKAELARDIEQNVFPFFERGEALPLIDSVFAFEDVQQAHAKMDEGSHIGKIVLTMNQQAFTKPETI